MFRKTCLATVVGLGVLVAAGCGEKGNEETEAVTTSPIRPPTSGANIRACSLNENDIERSVPRKAPAGVFWKRFKGVAVPFSPSAGPMTVQGEVARCYTHTPSGALMAAVQIRVRLERAAGWQKILRQQVASDAGKATYAQTRGSHQVVPAAEAAQIAGFRIVSYTTQNAVIGTVSRDPARGGHTAMTTTVRWDGDWKLVLTPQGSAASVLRADDSLSGYVRWGGF